MKHRILVVDDDAQMRKNIRMILGPDYEVDEAPSITDSLEVFERVQPDLITLDINMPGVTGIQGLQYFRHRTQVPIILISGNRSFELAREALRLGATDYLTKPFTVADLRQAVKFALNPVLREKTSVTEVVPPADTFTIRLPLENLSEKYFFSLQHRAHFLAFAQNVLSSKKRAFEIISIQELIHTVHIQLESWQKEKSQDFEIICSIQTKRMECDMYLLGGALANLLFSYMLKKGAEASPLQIIFDLVGENLHISYQKSGVEISSPTLSSFERWHQEPDIALDVDTALLVLAERVAAVHQGQFIVEPSSKKSLFEIRLPLKQPISTPPIL